MPQTHRILLIEADSNEVELITTGLAESGLSNVMDVVHDGEEALDYLYKRGKYADRTGGYPVVILLALRLPKIDGREVLRQLKTTEKINCIPVVVFAQSEAEQDIIQGYAYGAKSYVVKPFDAHSLFDIVKNIGIYWTMVSEPPPVDKCKIT
jgi:DNA-binding response OmpR family regulator